MIKQAMAALAVTVALTAAPLSVSFAAEATGNSGPVNSMALGVDISGAGKTDQSRKAFWAKMKPEEQAMVTDKCKNTSEQDRKSWSPDQTDFCRHSDSIIDAC